ncbi:hypothetical protein P5673_018594 [Acropora cervicornis]|uniref:Uncharacterized protein n=1 Tax=Acropora cervicornis TaxID=6130 RepID=A0AAD9QDL7_ACRCE|nr:hypothetical protein P5673_018594 [Acropora cervicornis]
MEAGSDSISLKVNHFKGAAQGMASQQVPVISCASSAKNVVNGDDKEKAKSVGKACPGNRSGKIPSLLRSALGNMKSIRSPCIVL